VVISSCTIAGTTRHRRGLVRAAGQMVLQAGVAELVHGTGPA
jgi:hypothetical protein